MSGRLANPNQARTAIGLTAALLLALAIAALFGSEPARATAADAAAGGPVYAQHCASCHQPAGEGVEGTFPPLAGNPAAADPAYVEAVIRDGLSGPIEVLGVSYDTEMPPVAALTDPTEIADVVDFVVELAGRTDAGDDEQATDQDDADGSADDEAAAPVVGDIDRGRDLFVGATRLENGGAACSACHTAGSVGNLGGPGLGPDLTDSFQALGGEVGLSGWMSNPPSQTMQPLFVDRPLNEAELADVVAFLGDAPNQDRPDSSIDQLTVAGIVGLVVLIAGMAVAWRGMRQTYVDRLKNRPDGGRAKLARAQRRSAPGAGKQSPIGRRPAERQRQSAEAARSTR